MGEKSSENVCMYGRKDKLNFKSHLSSWKDLVTAHEATRAGFIVIAFEKNVKSTPFIEEAKSLRVLAQPAKMPKELLKLSELFPSLLTASGLSDKSLKYLTAKDKKKAIRQLIKKFLEPAGDDFIDELVYRFLLTRGDTLGGMMRNLAGFLGEKKFVRCIISTLSVKGIKFSYFNKELKEWIAGDSKDTTIEEHTKGLSWKYRRKGRTLFLNLTPPFIGKNVDVCIFNCNWDKLRKVDFNKPSKYIALGELKGGIDPAGADEHWKTASTALERIRTAFVDNKCQTKTFFIGAAIEKSMAGEIYKQLENGILSNAGNLTNKEQLVSICNWICEL